MRRRDVSSVRYYFIDFGLSSRFDGVGIPRLVTGDRAQDREIPELSLIVPYDPFAVDIFTLGNVYKRNLIQVYLGICITRSPANGDITPDLFKPRLFAFSNGSHDAERACKATYCPGSPQNFRRNC